MIFAVVSKITLKWGYESFKLCMQWEGKVVESLSIKICEKGGVVILYLCND